MSEADYMDDCQHVDRWADENRPAASHEVVNRRGRQLFAGSRAACWSFKRKNGGFVREVEGGK